MSQTNFTENIFRLFFFLKNLERILYILVVGVVRKIVEVMFDSHEQAGQTSSATQLGGEDDTRDQVVSSGVG